MDDLKEQLQRTLSGSYTVERELGGGGMSRVFLAEETSLGRRVVIKVLPHDLAASVNLERFRREIQLAARLQHPHIVPVHSAGVADGLPYYTMPFIEGESLRARLSRSGELPINEAVKILRDVLSALAYAHEHGVVHRDIKPDNVLLTGNHAVVADFGVAKALSASADAGSGITSLGVALGTPAYMSPEQATADPATDHRSDIYSVGAMAYEMLCGHQLFESRSAQAMLAAQATEKPVSLSQLRPSVPPALSDLIMRALEKRPADRPQSAKDLLDALEATVTPTAGTVPHGAQVSSNSTAGRNRNRIVFGSVFAVAIIGLAAVWIRSRSNIVLSESAASNNVPSLAVLPFENLGKSDDAYFADGMTEEISSRLGELGGLRIIGRQSVRSYANTSKPVRQIGQELGVKYVLTGSVRWDRSQPGHSRVRISPALLRADDGTQVWSEPYEDEATGVFEIQSKVATKVADALKLKLTSSEQQSLAQLPTQNVEAYDLYLRANELVKSVSGPDNVRAAELLQQAVDLDPQFALGFATLADAHVNALWFGGDPSTKRVEMARVAANRAVQLQPNLAAAHDALGNYYYHGKRDFSNALKEFEIAQRLSPNDASASMRKGQVERRQNKWDLALADMQRAAALEPRDYEILTDLVNTLRAMRRFDEAIELSRKAVAIDPSKGYGVDQLISLYLAKFQNTDSAVAVIRRSRPNLSASDFEYILFNWISAAKADPQLNAYMRATPPPEQLRDRAAYYGGKLTLAMIENDTAMRIAAGKGLIAASSPLLTNSTFDAETLCSLATGYAAVGRKEEAVEALRKAMAQAPMNVDPYRAGFVFTSVGFTELLLGDIDAAVANFDKALSMPAEVSVGLLTWDPALAKFRQDPRFMRMLARHRSGS